MRLRRPEDPADRLTIDGIGISVGIPQGPRFTANGGTLALAIATPSAAAQLAGDTRSWVALKTSIPFASLTGIDGFAAYGSGIVVELNRASGAFDEREALDASLQPVRD